jgi:purine-binding chemotaxis protein CheW
VGTRRQLVTFYLDEGRYAVEAAAVRRVVRVVEVTPLPKAPALVLGVIDLHGQMVPVFDLRARFGLDARDLRLSDQLIIADTSRWTVALLVDAVDDVIEVEEGEVVAQARILPGLDCVQGVAATDEGLVVIHDLEGLLDLPAADRLSDALEAPHAGGC